MFDTSDDQIEVTKKQVAFRLVQQIHTSFCLLLCHTSNNTQCIT